jgi:L-lactate dehydrogenase complex protein LldG
MEREAFLQKLSERLKRPTPTEAPQRDVIGVSEIYNAAPFNGINLDRCEWPARFQTELGTLGGKVIIVGSLPEVAAQISAALQDQSGKSIITWDRSEFIGWDIDFLWDDIGAVEYSSKGNGEPNSDLQALARSAVTGVTTVSFAVVNSGSLVLYTNAKRNRSVSLLPTLHIALVRESQLVAKIGDALPGGLARLKEAPPSSIHVITGPSRSADIENELSIGVHGPAAVTAIICKGI